MAEGDSVKIAVMTERLEGHEKVCAERYGQINASFERIHGRLDWIMRGVLGLLIALVGYLLINQAPWFKVAAGAVLP